MGMLVELLDSLGFATLYDFLHLPVDLSRLSCLGFGFVNFRTQGDALNFFKKAHGFKNWHHQSNKVLEVSWSNPLQGLAAQIHRYRNSTVMHPSVPEQCRPALFGSNGEQLPFPDCCDPCSTGQPSYVRTDRMRIISLSAEVR